MIRQIKAQVSISLKSLLLKKQPRGRRLQSDIESAPQHRQFLQFIDIRFFFLLSLCT